jgi:hypothetical protein
MIEFANDFDPTRVDDAWLSSYMNVVVSQTGGALPEAMVSAWDIVLTYAVSGAITDADLTAAIATAMSIAEPLITILSAVTPGHTHNGGRRLAANKQVSISAVDAAKAKEYKDKSSSAATTDSLTSTLGAAVTVATAPVTKIKVETKVTSTKPKSDLETEFKSSTMVTAVGGTISSVPSAHNTVDNSMESHISSAVFGSGMMVATTIALAVVAESV